MRGLKWLGFEVAPRDRLLGLGGAQGVAVSPGASVPGETLFLALKFGACSASDAPGTEPRVFDDYTAAYNFRSNLPEQLDRRDGRLTLLLGNDNEDTIAAILKDGEDKGAVIYIHGLAYQVSQAADGEPIDIVLCRESLKQPFCTMVWKPE